MNASRPGDFNGKAVGNDNSDGLGVEVKVKRADVYKNHKTARFHISVGKDNHEHPKFRATMNWALQNFDRIIICVNDTLQRHNYMFQGETPEEAYAHARRLGDEWISRNIRGGMRQTARIEVKRWSDWTSRDEFMMKRDRVAAIYRNDKDIQQAIRDEVKSFWKRMGKREGMSGDHDFSRFEGFSTDYLLEECAAFSIMFEEELAADVYPGSSLLPCTLFKPEDQKSPDSKYGFTRLEFKDTSNDGSVVAKTKTVQSLGAVQSDARFSSSRGSAAPIGGGVLMGAPGGRRALG